MGFNLYVKMIERVEDVFEMVVSFVVYLIVFVFVRFVSCVDCKLFDDCSFRCLLKIIGICILLFIVGSLCVINLLNFIVGFIG